MNTQWRQGIRRLLAMVLTASVVVSGYPGGLLPGAAQAGGGSSGASGASPTQTAKAAAAQALRMPGSILENRGQAPHDAAYYVRAGRVTAYFTDRAIRYELSGSREAPIAGPVVDAPSIEPVSAHGRMRATVEVSFVGARPVHPVGEGRTPTIYNFHVGPQAGWVSGVRSFERVVYRGLWPGIDLVHETTSKGVKYHFEVHPGADPGRIRMAYRGAAGAVVDEAGQLVLSTAAGELRDDRPYAYQSVAGQPVEVASAFALAPGVGGDVEVGFQLGAYNPVLPLIIDPVVFAGYVGDGAVDQANAVAVGPGGVVYVAGETEALNVVDINAFVARINAAGTALLSMTYLGGNWIDNIQAIAVDDSGNSYVTGHTASTDLPIVNGFDAVCGNGGECRDAFMMKLNPSGGILYSTYLGGSIPGIEIGRGIAIDAQRRAFVVGATASSDFPIKNALYPLKKGLEDGFVTKIDPSASGAPSLLWSTFLGGSGFDAMNAVAVDVDGDAWVTGYAGHLSIDYPLKNPIHGDKPGTDVVVTKLKGNGSMLLFSTYLGSSDPGYEIGYGIAVDKYKNAYVTGIAAGPDFPTTPDSFKPQCNQIGSGCLPGQGFVAKLSPQGMLLYATYLGSDIWTGLPQGTSPEAIAVDQDGRAYVTGFIVDPFFQTTLDDSTCGTDGACNLSGGQFQSDAFVAVLVPSGAKLSYASYIGGHAAENMGQGAGGIAVGAPGEIYVVGSTASAGTFMVTPGAWDTTLDGSHDGFLVKLGIGTDLSVQAVDLHDPVYLPPAGTGLVQYVVGARNNGPLKATNVELPIRFLGRVRYQVMSVAVQPPAAGTCAIGASGQIVNCSFPVLESGQHRTVAVEVKVLSIPGGSVFEKLAARAQISADQPDANPANNQVDEGTQIHQ